MIKYYSNMNNDIDQYGMKYIYLYEIVNIPVNISINNDIKYILILITTLYIALIWYHISKVVCDWLCLDFLTIAIEMTEKNFARVSPIIEGMNSDIYSMGRVCCEAHTAMVRHADGEVWMMWMVLKVWARVRPSPLECCTTL